MTSKRRTRKFKGPRVAVAPTPPKVPMLHIKLALGGSDFLAAGSLLKSALLYADTVTIYSPAAALLTSIIEFAEIRDPQKQIMAIWDLADAVPTLNQPEMASPAAQQLRRAMQSNPKFLAQIRSASKGSQELESFAEAFNSIGGVWNSDFPNALQDISVSLGAGEIIAAINRGLVKVDPLVGGLGRAGIADSLRLASGDTSNGSTDLLVEQFLGRSLEILTEPKTFPLFDESSNSLIQSFSNMVGFDLSAGTIGRAKEAAAASSFMSYLPGFPGLPLDEIVELRKEVGGPLGRYRAAVLSISKTFESSPFDGDFDSEVLDSWRTTVEPSMLEIREQLAQHKLLRELRSIALGDPRRLMVEAGAVFAAGRVGLHGLDWAKLAAVLGVPVADLFGRSLQARISGQRAAKVNSFYFLHRISQMTPDS